MKKLFILIILIFTSLNVLAIKEGKNERHSKHPNLVKIMMANSICTGVRIHRDYILTVAHCFKEGENNKIKIKIKIKYKDEGRLITRQVMQEDVIIKGRHFSEELAIIPIQSESEEFIPFPTTSLKEISNLENTVFDILGFGQFNKRTLGKLKSGKITFLKHHDKPGRDSMFAVKMNENNQNPCHGDSGGPIFSKGKLVGVVSFIASSEMLIGDFSQYKQCKSANTAYYIPLANHLVFLTRFMDTSNLSN